MKWTLVYANVTMMIPLVINPLQSLRDEFLIYTDIAYTYMTGFTKTHHIRTQWQMTIFIAS